MKITTLENVPMSEITKAFNDGFSDYFVKFNATEEYLTNRWRGGRVDLSMSAGGWINNELVGILISGIDFWEGKLTAFNAATCVAPHARGNHFTSQAYEFLLPKLKEIDVKQLTLEVIQGNEKAIPVYERIGFKKVRGLGCFNGEPKIRQPYEDPEITIEVGHEIDLEKAILFHDFDPAWESTFYALLMNWSFYEVYKILKEEEMVGYAIVNSSNGQIYSFGVDPDYRRKGYAKLLFSKISQKHKKLKINNIDNDDLGTHEFLKHISLPHVIDQYEMKMVL